MATCMQGDTLILTQSELLAQGWQVSVVSGLNRPGKNRFLSKKLAETCFCKSFRQNTHHPIIENLIQFS